MRRKTVFLFLLMAVLIAGAAARAESSPITGEEIQALAAQVRAMAKQARPLNDPEEDAAAEDGYAWQFEFGVVYGDRDTWTEETEMNAFQVMDEEIAGPRGIRISWDVNQVMEAIPCENDAMYGTPQEATLYLEGEQDGVFRYGRVERDGQRITAIEYGEADAGQGKRTALVLGISGDGVESIRGEGFRETVPAENLQELYAELEEGKSHYEYARVPRSRDGSGLAYFSEADLDFASLSYRTAEPAIFGSNVEDMIIDNEDGTWLRRVDGEGFEAVFTCDAAGQNTQIKSYEILSPELEGPRGVRLGDLFHEDFSRFPSGEGALSEDGTRETLYGTEGRAPFGTAEYGDGSEMTLRYVTPTLGGGDVELILRYRDTVLSEIILHTMEEDENGAD